MVAPKGVADIGVMRFDMLRFGAASCSTWVLGEPGQISSIWPQLGCPRRAGWNVAFRPFVGAEVVYQPRLGACSLPGLVDSKQSTLVTDLKVAAIDPFLGAGSGAPKVRERVFGLAALGLGFNAHQACPERQAQPHSAEPDHARAALSALQLYPWELGDRDPLILFV
jgi:hypothetical protein